MLETWLWRIDQHPLPFLDTPPAFFAVRIKKNKLILLDDEFYRTVHNGFYRVLVFHRVRINAIRHYALLAMLNRSHRNKRSFFPIALVRRVGESCDEQ